MVIILPFCFVHTIEGKKISKNVIIHIVEATKYYLHIEADSNMNAKEVINNLSDSKHFLSNEKCATLVGCDTYRIKLHVPS